MATFRTSQCQDGDKVLKCLGGRCQGTKRRFRKLEHTGEHQEELQQVLCRKSVTNSELYKPNLRSKHLREWNSRSIRSRINMSKTQDC